MRKNSIYRKEKYIEEGYIKGGYSEKDCVENDYIESDYIESAATYSNSLLMQYPKQAGDTRLQGSRSGSSNAKPGWQRKIGRHRIRKAAALLLLAAAVGGAAKAAAGGGMELLPSFIVNAQSQDTVSSGDYLWQEQIMDGISSEGAGMEESGAVYLESVMRTIKDSPEDFIVVIDPGHGGEDGGCTRGSVDEKQVNMEIAKAVEARLKEMGYQVLLTRASDEAMTLEERVQFAESANADAFISIHQNACEYSNVKGAETWYNTQNAGEDSERLARLVQMYMTQASGIDDRGVLEDETLYVIRENTMPSCLVETGFLSNASERNNLTKQEYQDKIADGIASGINLFFMPKTMYLTFDDGPSGDNTTAVLDILKAHNIKATFFVVGENVKRHPEVARRIVEEGHTIGIHCNSHEYGKVYASVESYIADFEEAYNIVYEVTGVEAELFRFPGGSINAYNKDVYEGIIEEMTAKGYIYYDWNASLEDAVQKPNAETLLKNACSSTLGRRKIVMLAHDVVYETTQCLEELIEQFPDYRMEPLTPGVEPIQF